MKELKDYIGVKMSEVLSLMEKRLSSDNSLLLECNKRVLGSGGKRIRPLLTLLFAEAAGGSNEDTVYFAAATELIHNATLLHDDVADESPLRRGEPTVSSLLGPRPSVLLGDFWLANGLCLIVDAQKNSSRVMKLFSRTLCDLAEGEMLQLQMARTGATTEQEYFDIIFDKTASLFEVSALAGAISAGASSAQEESAACFARYLGLAFQIQDDILDYQGDEALGKPRGQDLREKKITLPLLMAFKACPSREKEIREKLLEGGEENIACIMDYVSANEGCRMAHDRMMGLTFDAMIHLESFPDSDVKGYLIKILSFVGQRNS